MADTILSAVPSKRRKYTGYQGPKGSNRGSFEADVVHSASYNNESTDRTAMLRAADEAVYMKNDKWNSPNHRAKKRKLKYEGAIKQLANDTF